MKKTLGLSCAAALLLAMPLSSYAQSSNTNMNSNSASQYAPGQKMQNDTTGPTTSPGASGYAPGQKMQNDITGSVRRTVFAFPSPVLTVKLPNSEKARGLSAH